MKKRTVSILLAILMTLSLLPLPAWAAEPSLTETQPKAVIGNVNGIGEIDISDLDCLYAYLTGGTNTGALTEEQFEQAADLNSDKTVNVYDLQLLYEVVAGIRDIEELPTGGVKPKIGFITVHDENSTSDLNYINCLKDAAAALGLTRRDYILQVNVYEDEECYETAVALAEAVCNIIFANSCGYEPYLIQAAREFPDVQFCHTSGTRARTAGLANYHNAFAAIHEGRYLTGIAAGMKLNEMIEAGDLSAGAAKLGFVASFPYAEVISAYTAFFLGVRSVCPDVTMDVTFTNCWYDGTLERDAAQMLIDTGCQIISQYADSLGAPMVCEERGIPNIAYNGSNMRILPRTYMTACRINWAPYYEYAIQCIQNGTAIADDWCGTWETGSVVIEDINQELAAIGTQEAIDTAKEKLIAGDIHVFDCASFTVNGETVTSYRTNVVPGDDHSPGTEVIVDGYFAESTFRSAPYFNLRIDGITLLNAS